MFYMSIAILMMIKDEFKPVKDIIKSVEGICEEKIIVITGDKKVKESGDVKILYYPWHHDYSAPLNAGLRLCKSKWVLRLDADEEIDEINLKRVEKAVNLRDDISAYRSKSKRLFTRKKGGIWG